MLNAFRNTLLLHQNLPCPMSEGIVIIPTYNEIENIETVVRAVFSLSTTFDVLVVDDNSPDGTADKVRELQEEYPGKLNLEVRAGKAGLGTAYVHGFHWAINNKYEYIFEMDADYSHNPADLEKLLAACKKGADVAIGSRYSNGVNVVNWPLSRVLLSYFASVYVNIITGMNIKDATAGFICYKRKVLESVNLDRIKFVGYAFQIEMKYRAYVNAFIIEEVPIIFTDRTKGVSKMSTAIFKEAIFGVIMLRIKRMLNRL
jgi:dolichol-phosphate mannosyltransferase